MAYGLQIYRPTGALMLDTPTRYISLFATYSVPILGYNGYIRINVADMTLDGTWAAICTGVYNSVELQVGYFYVYNRWYSNTAACPVYVVRI